MNARDNTSKACLMAFLGEYFSVVALRAIRLRQQQAGLKFLRVGCLWLTRENEWNVLREDSESVQATAVLVRFLSYQQFLTCTTNCVLFYICQHSFMCRICRWHFILCNLPADKDIWDYRSDNLITDNFQFQRKLDAKQ